MSGWQKMLLPFTPLYGAVVAAKNVSYDRGWLRAERLRWPVLSVGNVSVGGTGKTPVVLALVEMLREAGIAVDVLSRGYGRDGGATERVDTARPDAAERFGDEPVLLARAGEMPVFVGASRVQAGRLAEGDGGPRVHLLDDGFQHRKLARDFDLLVIHPADLGEWLLPAGRLREPVSALRRAGAFLLREEDEQSEARLRRAGLRQPVWRLRRKLSVPAVAGAAVSFCGIARPLEFFEGLRASGISLVETVGFRDHHRFSEEELLRVRAAAERTGVRTVLTTEKDWVRIPLGLRERVFPAGMLQVVGLRVEFLDREAYLAELLRVIER